MSNDLGARRGSRETIVALTIADDVISRKASGWEVFMATGGGTGDIDVFDQFVATFQFAS